MINVRSTIEINAPREIVAIYAADADNAPKWYVNICSMKRLTPRPLAIGSKIAFRAHFLGRDLSYTYEVVRYTPGARFEVRTFEGPFPMKTTYERASLSDRNYPE